MYLLVLFCLTLSFSLGDAPPGETEENEKFDIKEQLLKLLYLLVGHGTSFQKIVEKLRDEYGDKKLFPNIVFVALNSIRKNYGFLIDVFTKIITQKSIGGKDFTNIVLGIQRMMKKEEGQFNIWTLLLNLEETLEKIEQSNLPPEEKKVVQRLLLVPVGFYQKILRLLRCLLREGPFKENQLLMDITEQLRIFVLDAQSKNDDAENKYGIKESGGFGDDHIVLEGEPQKYPMGLTRIHVRPSVRKRYEARSLPSTPAGSPAPSPKGTPKTSPSQMRRRPLPQLPEGAVGGRPRTPSPHGDDTYEAVGGGESPYQLAGRPRSGRRRSRSTSPKRSDTYQLAGRPSPKEEGVDPYSLVGQPGTRPGTPPLETVYTLQGQPKPVDTTKEEQPVPPPRAQSLPSPPVSRPPTPPPPDYDTSTTTVQQRPKSPTTEKD